MWLDIYEGNSIWNGYSPSSGRFFPLASFDLNILMRFSKSPYLFFIYNACVALLFSLICMHLLNTIYPMKANFAIVALFMLSPGFVYIFFGICYSDKIMLLFLSIFVLCSYYMIYNPNKVALICGVIFLNLSIYLKEPVFISSIIVGCIFLAIGIKNRIKILRQYSILLISSSVIYLFLYIVLILRNIEDKYDRYTANTDVFTIRIQGLINYVLNDGIIVFLIPSLFIYRLYMVFIKNHRFELFFDSFLTASFVYFVAYLVLGIFETYYLLPCYVLGGFSIIYFLLNCHYIDNLCLKICLLIGIMGFALSAVPSGMYAMFNFKAQGVQFNEVLDVSAKYINKNPHISVYFDGIGRGRELYAQYYPSYYTEYLNRIYGIKDFDIKTNEKNLNDISIDISRPYTYFNSLAVDTPKKGDLIIINNVSVNNVDSSYINNMSAKYSLLYKTNFPTIPYINIKSLFKLFNSKIIGLDSRILGHNNIFRMPLDTYIYVVN